MAKTNIINLDIDIGNYNTKSNTGVIFRSTFIEGKPANPLGESVLKFNGKYYTMEKGSFNYTFNKADKNYLPNLLYAIIRSSSESDTDFNLMLGYPLDNEAVAHKFKEDLMNKEFNVEYIKGNNVIHRTIRIHDVKCIGEGISSFYTLNANERGEDLIIFDIGGRTTNVAVFQNRKLQIKFTYPEGTIDLFDRIATRHNNLDGDNKKIEDIERLIDKGFITDCETEYKTFLDDIMNYTKKKVDRRTYKNYFTGGGSEKLRDLIENYLEPKGTIMDNAIFSNCNGNETISNTVWKK